jgi:hypothetical protein
MQSVLGDLTALYMRGEFRGTLDDIGRLDEVKLLQPIGVEASNFTLNSEGWTAVDLTYRAVGSPPTELGTLTHMHSGSGGTSGGHIWIDDPTVNVFYWSAPGDYLGNRSDSYGASLSFHLKAEGGSYIFSQEDVVLVGGGKTLVFDTTVVPDGAWQNYTVGLTETGWRVGSLSGPAASEADMKAVLANLQKLYIRGEFRGTVDDIGRLDTVELFEIADCAPLETEGIPDLLGDYNDDGQVDAADYVVWRKNPGAFGGDPGGYNTWRANFGAAVGGGSSSGAATAVPEPSAFVSLLIGLAALARPARTAIRPGPRRRRT